jgi:hypothetical protein
LDENGSHEQGNLFLRTLGEYLNLSLTDVHDYTVQLEKPDHVDVSVFKEGDFAIFIENKVEHDERSDQFADLIDSLVRFTRGRRIPEDRRLAMFLTDDGRQPVTIRQRSPAGFLPDRLLSVKRVALFSRFVDSLEQQSRKSVLLSALAESYLSGISSHRGI